MKSLQDIAEIDPIAQELLEAAGYSDVAALKGLSLNEITDEVVKANHALEVLEVSPTTSVVERWLEPLKGEIGDLKNEDSAVNQSVTSKELLAASFAIPLSRAFIEKNDIEVGELLTGKVRLLSDDVTVKIPDYEIEEEFQAEAEEEYVAKSESELESEIAAKEIVPEPRANIELAEEGLKESLPAPAEISKEMTVELDDLFDEPIGTLHVDKMGARINKDNMLSMDDFREKGSRIAPLQSVAKGDLTRSTRRETNEGVSPDSRRYVRGVLHKRAGSFMFSLLAYLAFVFCIIAGFTLPLLTLLDKEKFFWAMFSPVLVIVGILIYFMFTGRASCPICNQKQFAPKNCLKHRDAHRWPLFGYMLPTALHALFYKWFKCIFCGTSVRLKE